MGVFSKVGDESQTIPNPAQRTIRWRGGDDIKDGQYRLSFYDRDAGAAVEYKLPFILYPLDTTSAITGVGDGYRYWSSEGRFGTKLKLRRTTYHEDGTSNTEDIAEGTYDQIKEAIGVPSKTGKVLPDGMKFTTYLYFFNPETSQIERFELKGSAYGAWREFTKSNRGWLQSMKPIVVEMDTELQTRGAVKYYQPKFSLGEPYSKEQIALITEPDKEVVEYIKAVIDNPDNDGGDSIDQTPAQYQGEENQETGGEGEDVNLEDVPFI